MSSLARPWLVSLILLVFIVSLAALVLGLLQLQVLRDDRRRKYDRD